MLLAIAVVLVIMWCLGFVMFHVSGALIHLLIVVAIVMAILHMFRGRSAGA